MFDRAIKAFEKIVGNDYIKTDQEALKRYLWGDIPFEVSVAAAVLPGSTEELQDIVKIANEFKVALYPISTGNNWGYGAAKPVRDANIIIDLQRMKRIIEVNTELAYAIIEPGVTQLQLYNYLSTNNIPLIINPTGAGPHCSIMGNTIERGYGITPYGDNFLSQCGMEVVLSNGEILKTGFGHYEQSRSTYLFKWGVGPYLDGLFTQSSFGIVTKIGVWLMPKPEYFEACYFTINEDKDVGALIDAIRYLLLHNVVTGSINLMHRNRVLTLTIQYPWEEMGGKVPISDEVASSIAEQTRIGAWNCVAALYGTKAQVKASKKAIKRVLRGKVAELQFVSNFTLHLLENFTTPIGLIMRMNIKEMLKVLRPSLNILQGVPNEVALQTPYWRMKRPVPPSNRNPAADNCGVIWLSPVVPMTKEDVADFRSVVEPIFRNHGFDCCLTLTTVTHRSFDCTAPVLYDRDSAEETQRADACYHDLLKACIDSGYIPYRFGIQSMAELAGRKDPFWDTVDAIKSALDPNRILSPGRYSR